MGEILAYAGPGGQHLVDVRMNIGGAGFISELVTNPGHYAPAVVRHWLVHPRTYHPEEFFKVLTEGDVAAGTKEIVFLLRAHAIIAQEMLEAVLIGQLARRHAFD